MSRVAFIGLGNMGYPMAGHLARAGHDVAVYNRTRSKVDAWVGEFAGRAADSPRAAADGAAAVFTCASFTTRVRHAASGSSTRPCPADKPAPRAVNSR